MKTMKYALCSVVLLFVSLYAGNAQKVAVHTDVLQYALVSPNLGFEVALSQHHAFAFSASTCPVKVSDRLSITHLSVMPEYRYWFRMPFYGHFTGASLLYSSYDIGGSRYVRTGNLIAVCADYGYSFIIGRRWNLIPHLGVGVGADMGDRITFVPVVAKIGVNIQMVVK